MWWGRLMWLACGLALAAPATALAQSAPDAGEPFAPAPVSQPVYGTQPPSADPARQQHRVIAADGVELYVETWLPTRKGGHVPPARVPTVVVMSPYLEQGSPAYGGPAFRVPPEHFTSRGYAYAQMHLRGTGVSGGCLGRLGRQEADDGARVIEYLGRDAPWSDGRVGGFGLSHAGGSQTAVAAFGDPARTRWLKAIVTLAPDLSRYAYSSFDGVPYFAHAPLARYEQYEFRHDPPKRYGQRLACKPETVPGDTDTTGSFRQFDAAREHRLGVDNVRAAVLAVHGHADMNVTPVVQDGFFDELPPGTPKAGVFGVFDHEFPHNHAIGVRSQWEREDFPAMAIAWYDRHLKGLAAGTDAWPVVQVQGTDGQWRTESDWPRVGGPPGQLALGPGGTLGAPRPAGATGYREGFFENTAALRPPGTAAVFQTGPLADRLEIAGEIVLDSWVRLDRPDAHVAVKLEAFDAAGVAVTYGSTVGFRSAQHLAPLRRGVFVQSKAIRAPVGRTISVRVRLNPTDLVVPKGGRLRLTLAGSHPARGGIESAVLRDRASVRVPSVYEDPSMLSGSATGVTVLHDCAHPSALRFALPSPSSRLLNVREPDEPADQPLTGTPAPAPRSDGGGLAAAAVCGRPPVPVPAP